MKTHELFTQGKALTLVQDESYSYVPRTTTNAQNADITVAFAIDFNTAGERLTKREAGDRYVAISYGKRVTDAASDLVAFMEERNAFSINVAGNGIYTFIGEGYSQAEVNQWVFAVLRETQSRRRITEIRSGGQTGIDQAGLVAAIALGIPALGLYPKGFRRRNEHGDEIYSTYSKLNAELNDQAASVRRSRRKFHVDKTLPGPGVIFVFGSNLAGRHGAGAAKVAHEKFGAIYYQGQGLQGMSYGIPTKDGRKGTPNLQDPAATLPLSEIKIYVDTFLQFARDNPDKEFFLSRFGCSLATHQNKDIAPLLADAPENCNLPEDWAPWINELDSVVHTAAPINIFSGSAGLGGALTNMSERAKEKGKIKHSYQVTVNEVTYPDSESAYQALKIQGNVDYNNGLMIDIISLKFTQHKKIFDLVTRNGGAAWLKKCSHFTNAKTAGFQSWEGQGMESRFIQNLVFGYLKALTGRGPKTRVVHVEHAPYDVYIGRDMKARNPKYENTGFGNPYGLPQAGTRENSLQLFSELLKSDIELSKAAKSLKGKTIGCWCKTRKDYDTECHGDILAAAAEGKPWVPVHAIQGDLFAM